MSDLTIFKERLSLVDWFDKRYSLIRMTDSIVTNPSELSSRSCPASSADKTDSCMIRSSQALTNFRRLHPSLCDFMDKNTTDDCLDGTTSTHLGDIERVTNMSAAYQGLRTKYLTEAMETSDNGYLRASSLPDKAQTALKKLHFDFQKELEFVNLLYWPNLKRVDAERSWPTCVCGRYEDGSVDMEEWEIPKTLAQCEDENQYLRFGAETSGASRSTLLPKKPKKQVAMKRSEASTCPPATIDPTSNQDRLRAWLRRNEEVHAHESMAAVSLSLDSFQDRFFRPALSKHDTDNSDRSRSIHEGESSPSRSVQHISRVTTLTTVAGTEDVPGHTTSRNQYPHRSLGGTPAGSPVEPHPSSKACTKSPMLWPAIGTETRPGCHPGSGISPLTGLPLDTVLAPAGEEKQGLVSNGSTLWSEVVRMSIANGKPWNLTARTSASAVNIDWTPSQSLRNAGDEEQRKNGF